MAVKGGVQLTLHIQPNARITEVVGVHGDALKIRLHAPPVDGKANEALIKFLAAALDVPRHAVDITQGQSSRSKRVVVASALLTPEMAALRLGAASGAIIAP